MLGHEVVVCPTDLAERGRLAPIGKRTLRSVPLGRLVEGDGFQKIYFPVSGRRFGRPRRLLQPGWFVTLGRMTSL